MKEKINKEAEANIREFLKTHDDGFKKYGAKRYPNRTKSFDGSTFVYSDSTSKIPRTYDGEDIPLSLMPYVPRLEKNKQK